MTLPTAPSSQWRGDDTEAPRPSTVYMDNTSGTIYEPSDTSPADAVWVYSGAHLELATAGAANEVSAAVVGSLFVFTN
jgi:hypothetical protein